MKRKLLIVLASLISIFLVATIVLYISQRLTYELYEPTTMTESINFNVPYINIEHRPIETNEFKDYLITSIRVENISNKKLDDFQFTIKFNKDMQKYAPVIESKSIKNELPKKSLDLNNLGHIAVFTSQLLIAKGQVQTIV